MILFDLISYVAHLILVYFALLPPIGNLLNYLLSYVNLNLKGLFSNKQFICSYQLNI